jgi:mono/diheme cytochrome c family protein
MNLLRLVVALILFAMSCLPVFAESAKQRGSTLFVDNGCQHCHTIRKVGGVKGPDLSGVGRELNKTQIRTQIVQGGREMPSFAEILKKAEVDDLVAYLHSCREKKPQ